MAENKQYITQNQDNGTVQISEDVIVSIVTIAVNETEGVSGYYTKPVTDLAERLNKKARYKGTKVIITECNDLFIECSITVVYGHPVVNVAKAVQENITSAVESMTGMKVTEVNVNICGITLPQ